MSLSLAIAVNVIADLAILGLLAYAMTRARRLTPHHLTAAATPSASPLAALTGRLLLG